MADADHIPPSKADVDRLIAERGAMFAQELARSNARFEERIRELSMVTPCGRCAQTYSGCSQSV